LSIADFVWLWVFRTCSYYYDKEGRVFTDMERYFGFMWKMVEALSGMVK